MLEILNIDYHKKRLLLKALNRFKTKVEAFQALGISERHFYHLLKEFNIQKNKDGVYFIPQSDSIWANITINYN